MPTEPYKPIIFISYAHADEPEEPAEGEVKWLSFVTGYLGPAVKHGAVEIWVDRLMRGGDSVDPEIERKLRACDIFLLLVSHNSTSSDYIAGKEIAVIRKRQQAGEDVRFYPLVVTPTPKAGLDLVQDNNMRPRDGKPLSSYREYERWEKMKEVSDELAEIAQEIATREREPPLSPSSPSGQSPPLAVPARGPPGPEPNVKDETSLKAWLRGRSREVEITIAARAALRVVPLVYRDPRKRPGANGTSEFLRVTTAVFRACALARAAGKYRARAEDFHAAAAAAASAITAPRAVNAAANKQAAALFAAIAASEASFAASGEAPAGAAGGDAVHTAARAAAAASIDIAVSAGSVDAAAYAAGDSAEAAAWEEVRADVVAVQKGGANALADLPLWSQNAPQWARVDWPNLQAALPKGEDWDVWIDWYEDRLRGGSRGDAYELVFGSVPQEEWDRGPAAANAWIKAHLLPQAGEWQKSPEPEIKDRKSLESWLGGQRREVAVGIAARAALRVAPLLSEAPDRQWSTDEHFEYLALVGAVFRASVFAWASARYPTALNEPLYVSAAAVAAAGSAARLFHADKEWTEGSHIADTAARASAEAAGAAAADSGAEAASSAAVVAEIAADSLSAEVHDLRFPDAVDAAAEEFWREISADVSHVGRRSAIILEDLPIWLKGAPQWGKAAWAKLKAALPKGQDWDVWMDWYERRLHGGSRGEEYELVFTSVPLDVWDKGPPAANAWIREHLPTPEVDERRIEPTINDKESLEGWLRGQSRQVAVAIAVRAALRVAPLAVRALRYKQSAEGLEEVATLASAVYRSCASARLAARYPVRANELRAEARVAASRAEGAAVSGAAVVVSAANSAASACYAALAVNSTAYAAASIAQAVAAASNADASYPNAFRAIWEETRADVTSVQDLGVITSSDLPLWSNGTPEWASVAWSSLQEALPGDEDWKVWTDWYEERLRGVSRGEEYELVFASVPLEVWDKGPAAANVWIREHLPKGAETLSRPDLPQPLPDLDSPFAYAWNASARVTIVAGAQNLPFYRFFKSEEEHRQSLERCRASAERLLESLGDGRYGNAVRREYAERLRYYINDLPKIAGVGNIMLADDEVRVLYAMFVQDAEALPSPFAAALARVIANQFALNDFYDVVRRHEQAVNAGNWTQPFPFEPAKRFFGAVDEYTPRIFEPEVGEGLHRVERASAPVTSVPAAPIAPSSAIQPPALPTGAPNAEQSREHQIATAANALWRVFLKGKDLPAAIEGWTQAAHKLGENVGPILDFLRGLGTPL